MRRKTFAACVSAGLLCAALPAATAAAGTARRATGGLEGRLAPRALAVSPIPNFRVGRSAASPVTAIVAPDGTAYLAYTAETAAGFASAYVCTLPRGATSCLRTTLLPPLDEETSVSDQPDSLLLGPDGTVEVLVTTLADADSGDVTSDGLPADLLEYVLNPSGTINTAARRVGSLDNQGDAIEYDNQILWVTGAAAAYGGLMVQETPAAGTFPAISDPFEIPLASTPAAHEFYFYGGDVLALANADLLIAWDDGSNSYVAEVNPADSFKVVGHAEFRRHSTVFGDDDPTACLATGTSGTYLLLRSTTDGFSGKLSLYRYTGSGHFSPARTVPSTTSDYGDVKLVEDADGLLSVYFATFGRVLTQETSSNDGRTWRALDYPSATPLVTTDIAPALNAFGAGVVFEGAGGTVADRVFPRVQPVWVHQLVSLVLGAATLKVGEQTTAAGAVSPDDAGQTIELQEETGQSWSTVATTAASASGRFSFTISARAAGTESLRVEATQVKGWFYADYSRTRELEIDKS